MSGLYPNEITLYLRPDYNLTPNHIDSCAKWLVSNGYKCSYQNAKLWLLHLQSNYPFEFKAIMSSYFKETDYHSSYKKLNTINEHKQGIKSYGDEPHMHYVNKN